MTRHINDEKFAALLEQVSMVLGTGVSTARAWSAVALASEPSIERDIALGIAHMPAHLLKADSLPGPGKSPTLQALVTCIRACDNTGAPLAPLLDALAQGLRDSADAERSRGAAFAGAQATARMLMALPLLAIALGYAVGADPLGVLFNSFAGTLMLIAGVSLTIAGWIWMRRLLESAKPEAHDIDPLIVIDILTHTVRAGIPLAVACERIGSHLDPIGPGTSLRQAGRSLLNGMDPARALADLPGEFAHLTTAAALSHSTGAHIAPLLEAVTRERRRARVRDVDRAAGKLAVRLVVPTGLTILPAFVILGIIPIITDLVTTNFGWG